MTVSELIRILTALPGDMPVTRKDTDYDELPIDNAEVIDDENGISEQRGKRLLVG